MKDLIFLYGLGVDFNTFFEKFKVDERFDEDLVMLLGSSKLNQVVNLNLVSTNENDYYITTELIRE